jgi:hypothetical protein
MTAPGDRTLERIAALLNQAEGTDNAAEREAFMKKAQQLATIHSLDLARARSHTRSKENSTPVQRTITVGERREHGRLVRIDLILGISHANDVKMTISHDRTRVYAHGFEEDINAMEALYASLVVQMADEAEKFLDKGEWKQDTVYRKKRVKVGEKCSYNRWGEYRGMVPEYEDEWGHYPVPKQTARGEFQSAFASQIETRLMLAKREAEEKVIQEEKVRASRPHQDEFGSLSEQFKSWFEVENYYKFGEQRDFDAELIEMLLDPDSDFAKQNVTAYKEYLAGQDDSEPGTELVLVQKKEEIQTFYEKKNPHLFKNNRRRGGYGGYQSNAYSDTARSAGREAGRNARIGSQGAVGGQRKAIGG